MEKGMVRENGNQVKIANAIAMKANINKIRNKVLVNIFGKIRQYIKGII
jgi:hypothetical protein